MISYDDFFDFENCEYNISELDKISTVAFDGFNPQFPYSNYVAELKREGFSDAEITEKVKETEKDLEWRFKLASFMYMQSKLHEKHESHKVLAGIMSQLHDLAYNTTNLDHDLTNMSDTIAWHVGSVADKLNDED